MFAIHPSILHDLAGELGPRPNGWPIYHKYPWNYAQDGSDTPQQTRRSLEGQIVKKRSRNQWKCASKHIPTETLRRKSGRGVAMINISEVVEGGEVDGEDAHRSAPDGQRGHDPGNGRKLGPAKPEKANR